MYNNQTWTLMCIIERYQLCWVHPVQRDSGNSSHELFHPLFSSCFYSLVAHTRPLGYLLELGYCDTVSVVYLVIQGGGAKQMLRNFRGGGGGGSYVPWYTINIKLILTTCISRGGECPSPPPPPKCTPEYG